MKKILLLGFAALWLASTVFAAAPRTIEMKVNGLVCAFCAQGIEKKLRKQDATADVFVNLEHKLVAVALKPDKDIADDALKSLLTEAGYTLKDVKRTDEPIAGIRARSEAK